MKPSDLIALEYKLKHARSKKAVIAACPELQRKTVSQVKGLIRVNTMILTGKSLEEQKESNRRRRWAIIMNKRRVRYG